MLIKQQKGEDTMNILSLLNSAPMYAICGGIIAFVAVVCAVFMVRAYRAGLAMGIDRVKLKRHSSGRYRPVGQPRHSMAVAEAFGHRRAAL